jgi:hypothetical protein
MPSVTAGNPNVFFIAGGGPVTLDSALTVSDTNSPTLAGATVEITGGTFAGDDDVLSANTAGTAISASYNSATETLILSGTDTLADYQAVLDTVTFGSSSSNPTGSFADPNRTISWTVNDGTQSSAAISTELGILTLTPPPPALSVAPAPIDFNGDGISDALWRNRNGTVTEWLMSGSAITSSANPTFQGTPVAPDSSWSVAGIADFNGDGKSDVLWRQGTSDLLAVWLMNGSTISSGDTVTFQGAAVKPDSSWSVAAVGDFNGDGDADILWRQNTGALADWSMNGSTITSSASLTYHGAAVTPDSTWSVAGLGDFNADGKSDILWRQSTTGLLVDWQMNGATVTSGASITYQGAAMKPDSSWNVAAVGDFTNSVGLSPADILWRQNTTGSLAMWLMNGSTVESIATVTYQGRAITPDSSWNIVEVGDFDGTSAANGAQNSQLAADASGILWQQSTSGALMEWQMNGAQIVSMQAVTSAGIPATMTGASQSQAKPADFA